ncbi:MAG TPA: XdhC/CoxI family protein [Thermomicrobiales bacterium]|nr:XdhC/CoxI family protein [Thermomicrobiales bacterium]
MAIDHAPGAPIHERLTEALAARLPVAVATIVKGEPLGAKLLVLPEETIGSLGDPALDTQAAADARALLDDERSETQPYDVAGRPESVEVFLETFPTPPVLLIFGGVHAAQPLCHFAKRLGFDVIVSDARAKLATAERFPEADRIIVAWPDEALQELEIGRNWYIAILTHDPKFDEPALLGTMSSQARYIGAVGSRKTNQDRRRRLEEAGATPAQMARIRGPIGLDIGADTPEEMAISILAEIISIRHGRAGGTLTAATGNIRGPVESNGAVAAAS